MRLHLALWALVGLLACSPGAPSDRSAPTGQTTPADQRTPILDFPKSFSEAQFRRSCAEARGYEDAQCECALRAIRSRFRGTDHQVALLYLQLTMIAEHDIEAITAWLNPGDEERCRSKPPSQASAEIARLHLAPGYLYGTLRLIEVSPEQFKDWQHRDEILAVRSRCLPPPASVIRQAERIEGCIEQALEIKHCSRCHDYRGVDFME